MTNTKWTKALLAANEALRAMALAATSADDYAHRVVTSGLGVFDGTISERFAASYYPLPPAGSYVWSTPMRRTVNALRRAMAKAVRS